MQAELPHCTLVPKASAEFRNSLYVDIEAGQLHREVGGYPNGGNHRMPVCCNALDEARQPGRYEEIYTPPSRYGAKLKIRYFLPR